MSNDTVTVAEAAPTVVKRAVAGRVLLALGLLAMVLLPAADRLAMVVEAGGLRTVRAVDLLVLLLGAGSFLLLVKTYGLPRLIRPSVYLAVVVGAVLLLVVITTQTCFECGRDSFARPTTVFRGLALLVASHLLFVSFTAEQRNRGVLAVATVATIWVMTSMVLLINWTWAPFLLYGQTPYLHQPFSSPVQAANFAGVLLLLGSGAALALNRPGLLYLLVPALTVAISQAGSRSGMALIVLSWGAFLALYVGRHWLAEGRNIPRNAIHLVASALVAVAVIGVLRTPEMSRSLAFLGLQPRQMASGAPDAYRARVWRNVLDGWSERRASPPQEVTAGTPPPTGVVGKEGATVQAGVPAPVIAAVQMAAHTSGQPSGVPYAASGTMAARVSGDPSRSPGSSSLVADPSRASALPGGSVATPAAAAASEPEAREAPHNVYLEFLVYGGLASMVGLIVVFALLVGLTVRYAWQTRRSSAFPFASALALAVLFVAAINYGNVTLHLSFVWVLFGLVTACSSSALQKDLRGA